MYSIIHSFSKKSTVIYSQSEKASIKRLTHSVSPGWQTVGVVGGTRVSTGVITSTSCADTTAVCDDMISP